MAGAGRTPKATLSRPNDQARRDAITTRVAADGALRGPDLPPGEWPERTEAWWMTLRQSPMAQTWIDADWQTLLDTALLHAKMWSGDTSVAAELRLRMGMFGTSPESRLRLRIAVDAEAETAKAAKPLPQSDRRRRLLRAVNDGA